MEAEYHEPYPTWILMGMDVLAAGILIASFRDAWSVVRSLGADSLTMTNNVVAGAVVLAVDAAILLLEQARSQVKLRGGKTWTSDVWVMVLIVLSAILNVRYLTQTVNLLDQCIGAVLGVAIPSTIGVLGYIKGDMLAYNARCRVNRDPQNFAALFAAREGSRGITAARGNPVAAAATAVVADEPAAPLFRLKRG